MSPVLVSVVWADAHASAAANVTLADLGDYHKPSMMETTGWLLRSNEIGVSLAYERCIDDGDETYRGYTFIPRAMVVTETPVVKVRKPRTVKAVVEVT